MNQISQQVRRCLQINDAVKGYLSRESPEKHAKRCKRNAEVQKLRRANESPKEHAKRLKKNRDARKARKAKESPEEHAKQLKKIRDARKARQAKESPEERAKQLKKIMDARKDRKAKESPEEHAQRLKKRREARKVRRAKEPPEEHAQRLKKMRNCPEESTKIQNKCGICLKDEVDAIFLPCGHIYACWECSKRWSSACSSTCPVCNQQIVAIINWTTQERHMVTFKKQHVNVDLGIPAFMETCVICGGEDDHERLVECMFCEATLHEECGTTFLNGILCDDCFLQEIDFESDGESEYVPDEPLLKRQRLNE